jgi:hypothetical protein
VRWFSKNRHAFLLLSRLFLPTPRYGHIEVSCTTPRKACTPLSMSNNLSHRTIVLAPPQEKFRMCIIKAQSMVVGIRMVKICTDKVKFRLRTWGFLLLDDTTIPLEYRQETYPPCQAENSLALPVQILALRPHNTVVQSFILSSRYYFYIILQIVSYAVST